ncbi:hypothetical protein AVEN_121283-1 [Araneus ventricosus]|uniref:Uncharacterized protein n=1 Tax=Araneus ventricosus TaxID=182803 RepID=A0A4Y2SMY2_ARAVE|nr:hypothetical protein AVEN_121283-1 [Araneus ventricosus]
MAAPARSEIPNRSNVLTAVKTFVTTAPQFQLLKILWVAVSSTVGPRVERCHHLQSVCLKDALVDQTDEKSSWSVLQHLPYSPAYPKRFSSDDENDNEMMTTLNTKSFCG